MEEDTTVLADPGPGVARAAVFVKSLSAPVTPAESDLGVRPVGRRVSFPVDELLVTGYVEPPNPWENAVNVTTRAVMAAYIEHCQRYDVTPLVKVIQQLQKIENFESRVECLDLQGEVLESGQIEALEEIFKRIQYVSINLTNTSLDDEGATALFDMIEYYESVERLNISRNKNISMRGWQACCRMIKRTQCLVELIASGILFDNSIHILQRTLRACKNLHTLHLENCSISGKQFAVLMAGLKVNTSLRELYLAENKLSCSDGVQIANLLRVNSRLRLLNLANNQLEDKGIIHITEGLSDQASGGSKGGLATLVLSNNRFTQKATPHLACVLMDSTSLEFLDLGENDINNEGIHCLKMALLNNRTLLHLGLKGCQITCQGAVALAEYIADSPTIQTVDLSANSIHVGGLMALTHSMRVNQSVTRLELDECPTKGTVAEDQKQQQQQLLAELSEYCDRNFEILEKRREEEKERPAPEEVLSEPISRLLSLWADPPLPRRAPPTSVALAPPITISSVAESPSDPLDAGGWQAVRGMSHLRSPQPSPLSSPIPSPTRNRFRVTRVFQEAGQAPPRPAVTTLPNGTARFKFTVTPVKSINGVDAVLPPLLGGANGDARSEEAPPLLVGSRQRTECDSPLETPPPALVPAQELDESSDSDSVFLDPPPVEEGLRHRHDSMTFYAKKLEKMRRSNSLPEELSATTVQVFKDRCIVLDSGVALDELFNRTEMPRPLERRPANLRFGVTRVAEAQGHPATMPNGVAEASEQLSAPSNGVAGWRSEVKTPQERRPVSTRFGVTRVETAPSELQAQKLVAPPNGITRWASAPNGVELAPAPKRFEVVRIENAGNIAQESVKKSFTVRKVDFEVEPTPSPSPCIKADVNGNLEAPCDANANSSLLEESGVVLVSNTNDADDQDDASSSGDRDSGIYLLDASGDDLETPHSDGEGPPILSRETSGDVAETTDSVETPCCNNAELADWFLVTPGAGRGAEAEAPHGAVVEAPDAVAPPPDAHNVSFNLVDIEDGFSECAQGEYSRAWVLQTASDAANRFFKSASSNSLDLLTGDDTEWTPAAPLGPCTKLFSGDDLMSFCEKLPDAKDSTESAEEDMAAPVQRLAEGCERRTDLVSIWVNGHEGGSHEWTTTECPSAAVTPEPDGETLTRRVVLEGSDSSSSSDSGVPESPISCSPPPVDVAKEPGFQAKKMQGLAVKSNGLGIGLQILERLDLKAALQLAPAQMASSKGLVDVAAEFLIQHEEPNERLDKRRESTAGCPGVSVHCGLPENQLTAT